MHTLTQRTAQPILLVEDNPGDYENTVRALRKSRVANPIHHCEDGDEALDFLLRRSRFADPAKAPRPGMVLLDLNIPGTDGREVLRTIKECDGLSDIPVIVLTTSTDERDITECYRAGANSYVQKPVDFLGFARAIERLTDYWFEIVILPGSDAP